MSFCWHEWEEDFGDTEITVWPINEGTSFRIIAMDDGHIIDIQASREQYKGLLAMMQAKLDEEKQSEVADLKRLVDLLGLALTDHNHTWTDEQRSLYDRLMK